MLNVETESVANACRMVGKLECAKQPKPDDKAMLEALKGLVAKQQEKGNHKVVIGGTGVVLYKCGCGVFTQEEYSAPSENYRSYNDVAKDLVTYGKATREGWFRRTGFRCDGLRVLRGAGEGVGRLGKEAFGTVDWTEKCFETENDNDDDIDQTLQMWMTVPVIPGCEELSWRHRVEATVSNRKFSDKLVKLMGQRNGYQARIDHDAFLSYANLCGGIRVEGLNTSWAMSLDRRFACLTKEAGPLVLHGSSYCVRKMSLEKVEGQPEMVRMCTGHLDCISIEDGWLVICGDNPEEEPGIQGNAQ